MNFKPLLLAAAAAAALIAAPARAALGAGDLAFTSFNADEDGWSMVTFVDLAANTTIWFTDNEWNGQAIGAGGAFNTGESFHQWTTGATTIAAGTVIRFSAIDTTSLAASVGTLSRGTVSGSTNFGISQTADTVYAYIGASATAPTAFLAAVSTGGFSVAEGQLGNTGLGVGSSAIQLAAGSDYGNYTGPRSGLESFAAYATLVNGGVPLWFDGGDGTYAATLPDTTPFSITPVPEPAGALLLGAGVALLGLRRRRAGRASA